MSETQVKNILMTQSEASESFDVPREITARARSESWSRKESFTKSWGEEEKEKEEKIKGDAIGGEDSQEERTGEESCE